MLNLHHKVYVCTSHKNVRDVTTGTVFYFKQNGEIIRASYHGGNILYGELIGMFNDQGILQAVFNYKNASLQIKGGVCTIGADKEGHHLQVTWNINENTSGTEFYLEEV